MNRGYAGHALHRITVNGQRKYHAVKIHPDTEKIDFSASGEAQPISQSTCRAIGVIHIRSNIENGEMIISKDATRSAVERVQS